MVRPAAVKAVSRGAPNQASIRSRFEVTQNTGLRSDPKNPVRTHTRIWTFHCVPGDQDGCHKAENVRQKTRTCRRQEQGRIVMTFMVSADDRMSGGADRKGRLHRYGSPLHRNLVVRSS